MSGDRDESIKEHVRKVNMYIEAVNDLAKTGSTGKGIGTAYYYFHQLTLKLIRKVCAEENHSVRVKILEECAQEILAQVDFGAITDPVMLQVIECLFPRGPGYPLITMTEHDLHGLEGYVSISQRTYVNGTTPKIDFKGLN